MFLSDYLGGGAGGGGNSFQHLRSGYLDDHLGSHNFLLGGPGDASVSMPFNIEHDDDVYYEKVRK